MLWIQTHNNKYLYDLENEKSSNRILTLFYLYGYSETREKHYTIFNPKNILSKEKIVRMVCKPKYNKNNYNKE